LLSKYLSRYTYDPAYSGVSKAAARATSTERLNELSKSKRKHQVIPYDKPFPPVISKAVLNYEITERINELARPKKPDR
ncbi:unnamed protein product, partial [Didymodactylos carnosus]